MICRRCGKENPEGARFCAECGALLAPRPAARRLPPWYVLVAAAAALLAAGFFLSRAITRPPRPETSRGTPPLAGASPETPAAAGGEPASGAAEVVLESPSGQELSRWMTAVVDGAWVALPAWALLGGGRPVLRSAGSAPVLIEWAVWSEGEPVVLCRLESEPGGAGARLARWQQDIQLRWQSIERGRSSYVLDRVSPARDGAFFAITLPEDIRRPGLFMQDDAPVGWTFGPASKRGYLWAGTQEVEKAARTRLDELTGSVLSGSREARFARLLALGDGAPPLIQLQGFVEAFRARAVFDEEDLPAHLRTEGVIGKMHERAAELTASGAAADVVRVLDDAALLETGSAALVEDVVLARARLRDHESALLELARLEKKLFGARGGPPPGLRDFEAGLYKDWLKEILEKHSPHGLDAVEKAKLAFPDDVEIHLLGVEVAVMEKEWARAAELLQMRTYPDALTGRVKMIENLIQEGQKDEGVVVLRFDPGTDHIPVEAYINGKLLQKFIIDTGATTSSIPSSAVDALGLKIDDSTKAVVVEGIAGRSVTYEVTLDSVELAGLRTLNVKAVVVNLASYEDTGILGQNFLNNFRVDIDYKKGILRLRKR
ncbi:MAG TPA: aspartyl protease family protein [Terriglobales bacterium]|nr:aspartyl protease family protein [Terriglobales bacterium]